MDLLTTREAAELLRCSTDALYVQRCRGQMPGALAVKVGRRLLYRRADIDRYFDDQLAARNGVGGRAAGA
jgi:excisionase family DNA binding protein